MTEGLRRTLLSMISKLALTLALALSNLPADLQADLDRCERGLRQAPHDYDAARCFHVAVANQSSTPQAKRQARAQTLAYLETLGRRLPEARYLDIVRGHLYWGDDPEQATQLYRRAAAHYQQRQDDFGVVIARANAAQLLFWRLHRPEEAQREMDIVHQIAQRSSDPVARLRATVLLGSYACDSGDRMGAGLALLQEYGPSQLAQGSYSLNREILSSRSTCHLYYLDFDGAERDLRALQELAAREQDGSTQALAAYRLGFLILHKLDFDSSAFEDEIALAQSRFEHALRTARRVGAKEQEIRALRALTFLAAGQSNSTQATTWAQACMDAASPTQRGDFLAFCRSAYSQALRERDPARAYELAKLALKDLPEVGHKRARIAILRSAMRRAWSIEAHPLAVDIANRALDAIESDREAQRATVARQQIFAAWTQDYYWLSYRLFTLGLREPAYLEQAFDVLERSRARVLRELMFRSVSNPAGSQLANDQSEVIFHSGQTPAKRDEARAGESVKLQEIQSRLSGDEAMVLYQTGPQRTFDGEDLGGAWAMVVTSTMVEPVKLPTDLKTLRNAVGILRDLVRRDDPGLETAAQMLAKLVFEPLQSRLPEPITSLIIIPDGPLHALPFSAIAPGYDYAIAPSATVWSQIRAAKTPVLPSRGLTLVNPLRKGDAPQAQGTVRSGDRRIADELRPLPESQREAHAIRRFLGKKMKVVQGAAATPERLTDLWSKGDGLLHISAHSDVRIETPEDSSLLLSNIGSGHDGRFTVDEIVKMPTNNALVVLAGCATGWGTLLAGEGMLSLARAFQRAGATAVVASLWPIRDDVSADFFERFYRRLGEGETVSHALAQARSEMKRAGYKESTFEGFVVIGDGSIRFSKGSRGPLARSLLPGSALAAAMALGAWWWTRRRRRARQ